MYSELGNSSVDLLEPHVRGASRQREPGHHIGQVLVAERDPCLAADRTPGRIRLGAGVQKVRIRSRLDAHLGQVPVQVLRSTTLWTELGSRLVQSDHSGYFQLALYLTQWPGKGVHLLLAHPATVDQDSFSAKGNGLIGY